MKKRMKNKKGFTLIELIVVIAILGILAAIAIPRLGGFRDTAAKEADRQTAKVVSKSIMIAVAAKDIPLTADTITLNAEGNFTPDTYDTQLEALVGPAADRKLQRATEISFTVKDNGDVEYKITFPDGIETGDGEEEEE